MNTHYVMKFYFGFSRLISLRYRECKGWSYFGVEFERDSKRAGWGHIVDFRGWVEKFLTFNIRESFTYDNRQCFGRLCFHSKLSDLDFHTARCPLAGLFVWILRRAFAAKQILAICGVAVPQSDRFLWAWRRDQARLIGRRCWNGWAANVFVGWIWDWNCHLVPVFGTAALFAL